MDKPLLRYWRLMRPIRIGVPALIVHRITNGDKVQEYERFTSMVTFSIDRVNDGRPVFETETAIYVPDDVKYTSISHAAHCAKWDYYTIKGTAILLDDVPCTCNNY